MSTINEDLLAAANLSQLALTATCSECQFGKHGDVITQARVATIQAIAAAERELAERKLPIDEAWIETLPFTKLKFDNGAYYWKPTESRLGTMVIGKPRYGVCAGRWCVEFDGMPPIELKSRGQLLDLLSGLRVEVTK